MDNELTGRHSDLQRLRNRLGTRLRYQGSPYVLVDILTDDLALVLRSTSATVIQANRHGEPNRRAPETVTVPIYVNDEHTRNPLLMELGLLSDS